MSANTDAFRASVSAASATKASALDAATKAAQGTIAASSTNVGYYSGKGGASEAAYQSAVVSANAALQSARVAAEMARQSSVAQARDTLRSQGEIL